MKKIYLGLIIASSTTPFIGHGQSPRFNHGWAGMYNFQFDRDGIASGETPPGCFGKGRHARFDLDKPSVDPVVTSRLEKQGFFWEVSSKDAHYLDVSRRQSTESGGAELIFTITSNICFGVGQALVDVFPSANEITFLTVGQEMYWVFQVCRKPLPVPPEGSYILQPHAVNSNNWYLNRVIPLHQLGLVVMGGDFPGWIKDICLTGKNELEYTPVESGQAAVRIDFSGEKPTKAGVEFLDASFIADYPCKPVSEAEIIAMFSDAGLDATEAGYQARRIEGGKDALFTILDQFQNQEAAATIRENVTKSLAFLEKQENP